MPAPDVTYSVSGHKISDEAGFKFVSVSFQTDIPYIAFECRATKVGEAYGVGKGALVASFSSTPAQTVRTFEVYDSYLLQGDGEYRISLFAQSEEGAWNDNFPYIPIGSSSYITADGKEYLCRR